MRGIFQNSLSVENFGVVASILCTVQTKEEIKRNSIKTFIAWHFLNNLMKCF